MSVPSMMEEVVQKRNPSPALVSEVADTLERIVSYSQQITSVLHRFSLSSGKFLHDRESASNVLNTTIATAKGVHSLLCDEITGKRRLYNNAAVLYIQVLALESASTLSKFENIIKDYSLSRKAWKAKQRLEKKKITKFGEIKVDLSDLKLDEEEFLNAIENSKRHSAEDPLATCLERLFDLQLHFLLVYQVATLGILSSNPSANLDVKGIVAYHRRIIRTAELAGIVRSKKRPRIIVEGNDSDSYDVYSSTSDSDSDATSILPNKSKSKRLVKNLSSPKGPELQRAATSDGSKSEIVAPLNAITNQRKATVEIVNNISAIHGDPPTRPQAPVNPPSYLDSHGSIDAVRSNNQTSNPPSAPPERPVSQVISMQKKGDISPPQPFQDDITVSKDSKNTGKDNDPVDEVPQLFKSSPDGLVFKIKSMFRSKESLAKEMKRTLSDTDSHLMAFVLQRHSARPVPHSVFHSLEATHMRTILSQLNDDTWYNTFTTLDPEERRALEQILNPLVLGTLYKREIVALKIMQEAKSTSRKALLRQLLRSHPLPPAIGSRTILAIVREQLVNGKPLPRYAGFTDLPPPAPFRQPLPLPQPPGLRPPNFDNDFPRRPWISHINEFQSNRIAPPFDPFNGPERPPPPVELSPPALGYRSTPVVIQDTRPPASSEIAATAALTSYNEYILRPLSALSDLRTWTQVRVTQESTEQSLIKHRVLSFQNAGGNVIEIKLRLSELQNAQIDSIMNALTYKEPDNRFEWCCAEISLHDQNGEIVDLKKKGPLSAPFVATHIHLIAKRMPKPHHKPLELYNALINRASNPPMPRQQVVAKPKHITRTRPRKLKTSHKRYRSDSSESESNSSAYSSESSLGNIRRRSMRHRREMSNRRYGRKYRSGDDSDSDTEAEEDVIKINVEVKPGCDVVEVLLEKWTLQSKEK